MQTSPDKHPEQRPQPDVAAGVRSICVFCGSKTGNGEAYSELARGVGTLLAQRGITLIYGGGDIGLMGVVADAAIAEGGEVIGVIPGFMLEHELGHRGVARLEVVDSMHERKARMAELSDAFLAMPGGIGTLEELFEIWTWAQLGLHIKPIGLLDADEFFAHLVAFVQHTVDAGFVSERTRDLLLVDSDVQVLLDRLLGAVVRGAPEPPSDLAGDGLART